jgi:hypothetical protein
MDCKNASPENHFKMVESVGKTLNLISKGESIIYEATFQYNNVLAALDILVKDEEGWKAYEVKSSIESELSDKQVKLERLKSTKSPFKVYLNKTLPMIENLSHYWDKADGKTKKKILGCIFTEKFENFDFESCNNIFTPEI